MAIIPKLRYEEEKIINERFKFMFSRHENACLSALSSQEISLLYSNKRGKDGQVTPTYTTYGLNIAHIQEVYLKSCREINPRMSFDFSNIYNQLLYLLVSYFTDRGQDTGHYPQSISHSLLSPLQYMTPPLSLPHTSMIRFYHSTLLKLSENPSFYRIIPD